MMHTMERNPVQCDGCAWQPSQSLEMMGVILVRYGCRSPHLWINKQFLCFESIEVTAENPFSTKYDVGKI